ncbi:hypothetical protein DBR11_21215 [Pedobacter sp. HMWF019]|uniref:hypothetical protein n=1 Tax=Pedobacter sp. HMWF019 TaxID=2056856 RepID=UPI000D3AAADD|nr:hypothetical protein [Pedobacter sp. HMWF019]PTS95503.1 hypothetical protein DBR11_21215 [Pedobacter sp. HMWF019]
MNNTFNLIRFLRLFKKQTAEQYKTYLMSVGVLIGILALLLGFMSYSGGGSIGPTAQGVIFFNLMLFSGTIFTSLIFADLGNNKKSIPILTLPSSHLEKYLVAWLYSFVIFQVVYIACFYVIDYTVISIGNIDQAHKSTVVNVFSTNFKIWVVFPIFAVLHSICFIGSVFFEKLHFIKTAFTFFIFLIFICLINPLFLKAIFDVKVLKGVPFNSIGIEIGETSYFVRPNDTSDVILLVMAGLLTLVLWTSTYFRLKEKQV